MTIVLNLKEKVTYRNILRRSINQNLEKAKHIMENFSENDNFNELVAIKTVTGEKYSKIKTLNEDIFNILLEQVGDNDRKTEIEEKTSDEFDLKYRINLFQIESFMTKNSFSETAENNSREVHPNISAAAFVKPPTMHCVKSVQIRSFFWSAFSRIRTEYGEIRSISPYLVPIRENTDQKNSVFEHFLHSDKYKKF